MPEEFQKNRRLTVSASFDRLSRMLEKKCKPMAVKYDVSPRVKMIQDWIARLPEKTGKSLEQWVALTKKSGPKDIAARRDWLKKEHGMGTYSAGWIAERAGGKGAEE